MPLHEFSVGHEELVDDLHQLVESTADLRGKHLLLGVLRGCERCQQVKSLGNLVIEAIPVGLIPLEQLHPLGRLDLNRADARRAILRGLPRDELADKTLEIGERGAIQVLLFLQQHPPLAVHVAQSRLEFRTSERPIVLKGLEQLQAKGRRHDGKDRVLIPAKGGLTVILDRILHEHVLTVEHASLLHPLGALASQTPRNIHARVDVQRRVLLIA